MVLLLSAALLFASHIISDGTLPDDVLEALAAAAGAETYGRGDLEFTASGYSEDSTLFPGKTLASFMLSFSGKEIKVEFLGGTREELLSSLAEEMRNLLMYEVTLYSGEGPRLDYITGGSYSFLADRHYRRGTRLKAVDTLGRVRGVFETGEVFDEAVVLDPVYLSDPLPGMQLEDAGEWKTMLTFASGFDAERPEMLGLLSIGRTDIVYPFVPLISAAYRYYDGESFIYGGIGLEAYLNLSRIFPSVSFTLVEEGRIGGSVSLLLGYGESFDWRAVFSVFYEHRAAPSFFWRLGYQNLQGTHMMVVGMGGDW